MQRFTLFNNPSICVYQDGLKINVIMENKLVIHFKSEVIYFSDDNKPVCDNGMGETIVEYSGLTTDNIIHRSFAKASFLPLGMSATHYHKLMTEDYYIFSGEGQVIIDDEIHQVKAGSHVQIAAGKIHQVINTSDHQSLHLLILCQPVWRENDHFQASYDANLRNNIITK